MGVGLNANQVFTRAWFQEATGFHFGSESVVFLARGSARSPNQPGRSPRDGHLA
jgi:hypothetical protein